ncbi:MAG: FAD-dependent oxidoreductase [Hyphomicrobium sp.]|jgi:glycine oxidase
MASRNITIVGAGILGLWQALTLARAGHRVSLFEASDEPFAATASRHAGAMLAPDCEAEAAPPLVRDLGYEGLALWRATYPHLENAGTLVVAAARDQPDLTRFARHTVRHATLDARAIAALEPDLEGRYERALYFADEAHMTVPHALTFLLQKSKEAEAEIRFATTWQQNQNASADLVIDCRGLAARSELPALRGVRGERLLIRTHEIKLSRPVRLLHPRHPLYVVPWTEGRFLIGATVIESEDPGPMTVRSALELLGTVYALHPAFGEAEILETGAGIRPAFPDNVPRALARGDGRHIFVNGAYRHGYLLAPVLAKAVAEHIATGATHPLIQRH